MRAAPVSQGLDLDQIGLTLQALIAQSGREVTILDQAEGVSVTISPDLVVDPSGMLPMFVMAAETVWRDATGKGFSVTLQPDEHALLGHRLEAVSGASFSTVMLSMMEAIEQVALPQVLPCSEILDRWHETTERLAQDALPTGRSAVAASPGAGR